MLDSVLEQVSSIEALEQKEEGEMKVIAVMNQKGGTGKTTSASTSRGSWPGGAGGCC
mgnify:CR=1 FL=1